jgi:serine/threonine-protein kinase
MNGPLSKGNKLAGRYVIQSWVGAGGMQNVYLARDAYFDRSVALKIPKEDTAVRRFEKSAVVSARVNHSNIAKTLDYFTDDANAYLIEEFVEGSDLSKIVPSVLPYLPPSTAARLLHMLAKGLAASHHAGVVHRDLKPSNIMIVGGYKFLDTKITDFGIATMAAGEIGPWAAGDDKGATSSKTILGAIPYMAPESITNFKTSDRPSDVWSIAAIVYELLAGQKPFGRGPASIQKILAGKPPASPAQISAPQFRALGKEVYDVLLRCFLPAPESRPTADELVAECSKLCYAIDNYEMGRISKVLNSYVGFISSTGGKDLMYHRDSFYGDNTRKVGDQLWFGRHRGGGNDRAFPIVRVQGAKM